MSLSYVKTKAFKLNIFIFIIYTIFYLILFFQFPLNNSIPGNCDTWLAIALSNNYINFFADPSAGTSMYPVSNLFCYGEASPGCAFIFIFFRLLGFNNIYSYYFFITFIFSLSAFGIYILTKLYTESRIAAFLGGLSFTCSNFMFANIDDSIVIFYFLTALSIYCLKKFISTQNGKYLLYCLVSGGIEIYFSLYVFIFQCIVIIIILLLNIKTFLKRENLITLIKGLILYIIIIMPFFLFYLVAFITLDIENPWSIKYTTIKVIAMCSLEFKDLFKVLPGNLIYRGEMPDNLFWPLIRKYAFSGFLVFILALLSFKKRNKEKMELILIFIAGFLISSGQIIKSGETTIYPFFIYLYNLLPLCGLIRVPLRAYFLCTLSISILAASGFKELLNLFKNRKISLIITVIILLAVIVENTPLNLIRYNIEKYEPLPGIYKHFLDNTEGDLILDLPSDIGLNFKKSGDELFGYNREIIYMNWQTEHKKNIIGGVNGYYPGSRVILQKYINELPGEKSLGILAKLGLDYIVFHKNMILPKEEYLLPSLENSDFLKKIIDTNEIAIFSINNKSELLKNLSPEEIHLYRDKSENVKEILSNFIKPEK